MAKVDLLVFSVIRNGIQNGYPFVECYGSWLNHCDRLFILEGNSTDGTDVVLKYLSQLNPKLVVESAPWPTSSTKGGSAIAQFTNECFNRVKTQADRLFYIQADEILAEGTRRKVQNWRQGAAKFSRYILFWNSFYKVIRFEANRDRSRSTAWQALRLFPAEAPVISSGDGLSFEPNGPLAIAEWEDEVFHYGWNFPINILQKHTSHANLYSDNLQYRKRALISKQMLLEGQYCEETLDNMDPQYIDKARPFIGRHPACMQHVLSQECYDPYIGLELLRKGVKW